MSCRNACASWGCIAELPARSGQLRSCLHCCHSARAHERLLQATQPLTALPCPQPCGAQENSKFTAAAYASPSISSGLVYQHLLPGSNTAARHRGAPCQTTCRTRARPLQLRAPAPAPGCAARWCTLVRPSPPRSLRRLRARGRVSVPCLLPCTMLATAPGALQVPHDQRVPRGADVASRLKRMHVSCTSSPRQQHLQRGTGNKSSTVTSPLIENKPLCNPSPKANMA